MHRHIQNSDLRFLCLITVINNLFDELSPVELYGIGEGTSRLGLFTWLITFYNYSSKFTGEPLFWWLFILLVPVLHVVLVVLLVLEVLVTRTST